MPNVTMMQIGYVRGPVQGDKEDFWGNVESKIVLEDGQFTAEALKGLEEFSHVEVLFHFCKVGEASILRGSRHPRGNPAWPVTGIFAQRGKARPNRIGATICRVVSVSGLEVTVSGLDAFDGTPVLDIKPVLAEFLPDKNELPQPQWSHEMMSKYFETEE
jgi:tRNA (adenine37-N6)-methyltransferase